MQAVDEEGDVRRELIKRGGIVLEEREEVAHRARLVARVLVARAVERDRSVAAVGGRRLARIDGELVHGERLLENGMCECVATLDRAQVRDKLGAVLTERVLVRAPIAEGLGRRRRPQVRAARFVGAASSEASGEGGEESKANGKNLEWVTRHELAVDAERAGKGGARHRLS